MVVVTTRPLVKPMLVVATKIDAAQDPERIEAVKKLARKKKMPFFQISAVTGEGVDKLKRAMAERAVPPAHEEAAFTSSLH